MTKKGKKFGWKMEIFEIIFKRRSSEKISGGKS